MGVKSISIIAGFLGLWAGSCAAAQTAGQGVIRFTGSIVESGCATNARSGAVMEVTGCASASRGSHFDVRNMTSAASVDAAHVRLVAETRNGRYYDQRYVLVDGAGKLIQSGNYVVTISAL